jgi:hypothetical protein
MAGDHDMGGHGVIKSRLQRLCRRRRLVGRELAECIIRHQGQGRARLAGEIDGDLPVEHRR